jgi:hypothetical protein
MQVKHWIIDLKNQKLKNIYESYLYRQERTLTFYLASVAVSNHASFPTEFHNHPVRASTNFDDNATSIRSVGEIHRMVTDGRYDQLSRSFSIFALITSFGDFFDDIRKLVNLNTQEIKKPIKLISETKPDLLVKTASLKIAHHTNLKFGLNARVGDDYSTRWINCIINLRHMFVHDGGQFNSAYAEQMFSNWCDLKSGDPIVFNQNQVDSILWFLNDHVRDFTERLDAKTS